MICGDTGNGEKHPRQRNAGPHGKAGVACSLDGVGVDDKESVLHRNEQLLACGNDLYGTEFRSSEA